MEHGLGYTRYPTETNDEYKYWGWWGPGMSKWEYLRGILAVFVILPLLILGIVALIALVLVAIAVPPVGILCIKAVCASG